MKRSDLLTADSPQSRPDPLAAVAADDLRPTERPRAVQYFSDEYLQRCRCLSVQDIMQFLEEFRLNYAAAEAGRMMAIAEEIMLDDREVLRALAE